MIEVTQYKQLDNPKGATVAFLGLSIPKWGLNIEGCTLVRSKQPGEFFIGLPQERYQNAEGETKYKKLIWFSEQMRDRFQKAAMEAVNAYCKQNSIDNNQPTHDHIEEKKPSYDPAIGLDNLPF